MTSRSGKNKRGGSGFVKKSAKLSSLRTKGTVSSRSSTNLLPDEEVPAVNVFGPRVVLGFVGQVDRRLVVEVQSSRVAGVFASSSRRARR
eukprot:5585021-Pleurochrysis_carterae.AAC.1